MPASKVAWMPLVMMSVTREAPLETTTPLALEPRGVKVPIADKPVARPSCTTPKVMLVWPV